MRWIAQYANLLVVFLLVTLYISMRGESRQILPRFGYEGAGATQEARVFTRGHVELWLFHPPLAASGGRTAYHRNYSDSHLRGLRIADVQAGSGAR